MPFNGSGVYQRVRNWVADAAAGIKVRADFHDVEDDGFAAGLSNCITRDGQTVVTQNIPFNNKRITGLADPLNAQDASTKAYADTKLAAAGGTATGDVIIAKTLPTLTLNATDGTDASVRGQDTGKTRWIMRYGNGTVEGGANAGSDFDLLRYADDGTTLLGASLMFNRATGLGSVAADPTAVLGIATKGYVDSAISTVDGANVNKAGDTMTGPLITTNGTGINTGDAGTISVRGPANAALNFLIPSVFGANFGLGADGNFYMGGGSYGAVVHQFWTKRDFAALPAAVLGVRLVNYGDIQTQTGPGGYQEPVAGGVVTGWGWYGISGQPAPLGFRVRIMQVNIGGSWITVSYV